VFTEVVGAVVRDDAPAILTAKKNLRAGGTA
jgi:hypothetical protein